MNDGYLNDIRGCHAPKGRFSAPIDNAKAGPVEEGSVATGTGASYMGWNGRIGASSWVLPEKRSGYTLRTLVLANSGSILIVNAAPVGRESYR